MKSLSDLTGRPVWMEGRDLCLIDQRLLPHALKILRLSTYPEAIAAIREMAVRGAGTIGVTGGFAMAQAALAAPAGGGFWQEVERAAGAIAAARPTAKNLSYAVDRVRAAMKGAPGIEEARRRAVAEGQAVYDDDARMTEEIAKAGLSLFQGRRSVLTHCNAGWLAYPGWGSALAPIYLAHRQGQSVFVYATETRPRSQGAKLTSWELTQAGVPHALIADTAAGHLMAKGEVELAVVGADRIAANGDTANKIGTYTLAVLAREHRIPFYVAAPSPTFDAECPSGDLIPIEERDEKEVLEVSGLLATGEAATVRMANPGTCAKNPAFDVTPARLITGFITEQGIVEPNAQAIGRFLHSR
ncbi:MAG: S-methyl-5-thioribose-1-phosphate isomerase [Candidatus Omnitrophica bacterium]|nr:S-methyl-5-thioribose-1-phosphate isomerase [Candidatus Omnitrophota bacterium]